MLSRMSKREKKLFGMTAVVLLAVGGYFGVYENLRQRWSLLNENIEMLQTRLVTSKEVYLKESSIEEEYEQVVQSLSIEGSASDKQIKIMQEISELMSEAGVASSSAKPERIDEEDNFQIFNFSYNDTETDMVSLMQFMRLMEEKSKVSEVLSIDIKSPPSRIYEPGEQNFKTNFKISRLVYRR